MSFDINATSLSFQSVKMEVREEKNRNTYQHSYIFFFFFLLKGRICSISKFPGKGSNQSCSCWPMPLPQPHQCQIRATCTTYAAACGNTGSLTHWARPGIKPISSWILVRLLTHWATTGTLPLNFKRQYQVLAGIQSNWNLYTSDRNVKWCNHFCKHLVVLCPRTHKSHSYS